MTFNPRSSDYSDIDVDYDYASLSPKYFKIDRSQIVLGDILGVGQFGDVFKGAYNDGSGKVQDVAVKTCKLLQDEDEVAEKFIKEAEVMVQFDHAHIIQLVGVCTESPVWIVMEFAPLGELREFLRRNEPRLGLNKLTLYCYQLSNALTYLETKKVVHRDIAARNVLVSTEDCVKLADFGLSRWVEERDYYQASRGKLPVKWMAPESINYRRFTTASDVWMFGVCMWEIMSYGVKPFQSVSNDLIIDLLDRGERLQMPVKCHTSIYSLMLSCWMYDPHDRPRFADVKNRLREILSNEIHGGRSLLERRPRPLSFTSERVLVDKPPPKPTRSGNLQGSIPNLVDTYHMQHDSRDRFGASSSSRFSDRDEHWSTNSNYSMGDFDTSGSSRTDLRLMQQQKQTQEDNAWLQGIEQQQTVLGRPVRKSLSSENQISSTLDVESPKKMSLCRRPSLPAQSAPEFQVPAGLLEAIELDRTTDDVFSATAGVISSITEMMRTATEKSPNLYVPLVKTVGENLKVLQTNVDALLSTLPTTHRNKVEMAQRVLNADMTSLVNAMKLALKYSKTVLNDKYRRDMLQAAHVIAVDSKNLLDTVDTARRISIYLKQLNDTSATADPLGPPEPEVPVASS